MTRRGDVLNEARNWIGTPYRHQGSLLGVGCDCLGLVRGIWRALYGREPELAGAYAADWAEARDDDPLIEAAQRHFGEVPVVAAKPGDLLIFRWRPHLPAKHLGILSGPSEFIHAYEGHAVLASPLVPHWRRKVAAAFVFPS